MRQRLWIIQTVLVGMVSGLALRAAEPTYQLSVVTDKPEALYAAGEPAQFRVTLKRGDQLVADAAVAVVLDKDGMPPVRRETLKLAHGEGAITGTLSEPGFLLCRERITRTAWLTSRVRRCSEALDNGTDRRPRTDSLSRGPDEVRPSLRPCKTIIYRNCVARP